MIFVARQMLARWGTRPPWKVMYVAQEDEAPELTVLPARQWCPNHSYVALDPKNFLQAHTRFTPTIDAQIDLIQMQGPERKNFSPGEGYANLRAHPLVNEEMAEQSFSETYTTQPIYFARVRKATVIRRPFKAQRYWVITGEKHYLKMFGDLGLTLNVESGNIERVDDERQSIRLCNQEPRTEVEEPALFFYGFINIYHLLMECLPILYAWKKMGVQGFKVICRELNDSQKSVLKHFGVREHQLIEAEYGNFQCSDLYFPSFLSYGHVPAPSTWAFEAIAHYRAAVLGSRNSRSQQWLDATLSQPERIYISRADASQRRVENEKALVKILKKHGFSIVVPGDFSLEDQVYLFAKAKIIVAPHGMGLTNMLWSDQLEHVVELFSTEWIRNCFFRMAQNLGVNYHASVVNPVQSEGTADMVVDIQEIERILERIV